MASPNPYPAGVANLSTMSGTEVVVVDGGGATKQQAPASLLSGLWSYGNAVDQSFVTGSFTSAQTVTLGARTFTALHGTQTAAALTVNLPTGSLQGTLSGFSIDVNVTALTVGASGGQTIVNAPSTASTQSAGFAAVWIYNVSDTSWYRRQ